MEVGKPGALESAPLGGPQSASLADTAGKNSSVVEQRLQAPGAGMADQFDISPLDVSAALRILIAEVRQAVATGLPELLLPSTPTPVTAPVPPIAPATAATPGAAAGSLVATFLAAVPADEADAGAWMQAVARLEQAFLAGYERAATIVTAWSGVTPEVLASVHASQTLFVAALTSAHEPDGLVRAEWLRVAPRLQRFRRRRRVLQRRLEDPDHRTPQTVESRAPGDAAQDEDPAAHS